MTTAQRPSEDKGTAKIFPDPQNRNPLAILVVLADHPASANQRIR